MPQKRRANAHNEQHEKQCVLERERALARAKAIYMFIIVGVVLAKCCSACDVSYSESLNWNSYFSYYVIHDFMKFELVHFVYSSCLFSCLKVPAQAHPEHTANVV